MGAPGKSLEDSAFPPARCAFPGLGGVGIPMAAGDWTHMSVSGAKIGIGIVTFNRLSRLKDVVQKVRDLTTGRYELVVADDGSTDGTQEYLKAEGIRCVFGPNMGVCWNKNRALVALETLNCDPILLLEDDCYPVEKGWDVYWRMASALWGHVCFAHPKLAPWIISGRGTPDDPIVNQKATAQCAAASAVLLRKVGFYDTRFKGYGVGHAEWTTRAKRAGYGYKSVLLSTGQKARANLYISGGLVADDAPTHKDRENIARNERLFDQLKNEPVYRLPWETIEQKVALQKELRSAGLRNDTYFGEPTDVLSFLGSDSSSEDLYSRLAKSKTQYKIINRLFSEKRSFLAQVGWLETISTSISALDKEIIPSASYAFIHFLLSRESPEWRKFRFLEMGAGYSSLWWRRRVADVISVDENATWLDQLSKLAPSRVRFVHHGDGSEDISQAVLRQEGKFEFLSIAGRLLPSFRIDLLRKLADDGVVFVNIDHGSIDSGLKQRLSGLDFRSIEFSGLAPSTMATQTTAVFYRTNNVLNL